MLAISLFLNTEPLTRTFQLGTSDAEPGLNRMGRRTFRGLVCSDFPPAVREYDLRCFSGLWFRRRLGRYIRLGLLHQVTRNVEPAENVFCHIVNIPLGYPLGKSSMKLLHAEESHHLRWLSLRECRARALACLFNKIIYNSVSKA